MRKNLYNATAEKLYIRLKMLLRKFDTFKSILRLLYYYKSTLAGAVASW